MTQFRFVPPPQPNNNDVAPQERKGPSHTPVPGTNRPDPTTGHYATPTPKRSVSSPLYNEQPSTQSLITALQSTISPSTAGRMVIIPGNGKRRRTEQLKATRPSKRMKPQVRYAIIIGTVCAVFLATLLSLAPLSSGQNPFSSILGTMNSADAQQQSGNIPSHDPAVATATAVAATGGTTSGVTTAPIVLPTSQYVTIARQDALNAGINPDYFQRQIYVESSFNPNAVSPYGAVGIAQFLPSTAAGLGIDPWDPIQALRGAAQLMARYASMYNGNYAMALAAYNAGTGTLQNAVKNCGNNWMNCLPYETQSYIQKIING